MLPLTNLRPIFMHKVNFNPQLYAPIHTGKDGQFRNQRDSDRIILIVLLRIRNKELRNKRIGYPLGAMNGTKEPVFNQLLAIVKLAF